MIGERGNHGGAYHDPVLKAIPPHAARALDVAAGDGSLARALGRTAPCVWAYAGRRSGRG